MTRFLTRIWTWLRSHDDEPSENGSEAPEPTIEYKTYIYSGGVEEGEWITKWVVRHDA